MEIVVWEEIRGNEVWDRGCRHLQIPQIACIDIWEFGNNDGVCCVLGTHLKQVYFRYLFICLVKDMKQDSVWVLLAMFAQLQNLKMKILYIKMLSYLFIVSDKERK